MRKSRQVNFFNTHRRLHSKPPIVSAIEMLRQQSSLAGESFRGLMCGMGILRLSLFLLAMAIPVALLGQAQPKSRFVVWLKSTKVDLPRTTSTTCLTVFPDGRFHMERGSERPYSKLQIFEDSLPVESLKTLSALLETQDLKDLRSTKKDVEIAQGEIVWAVVPQRRCISEVEFCWFGGFRPEHSTPRLPRPVATAGSMVSRYDQGPQPTEIALS